jgi:hypothetical protein
VRQQQQQQQQQQHNKRRYGYVGQLAALTGAIDGMEDHVFNNYAVINGPDVGGFTCSGEGRAFLRNNRS